MVNQNLNQKWWVKMNWKSQAKSEIVIQIRNGESNWIGKLSLIVSKKGNLLVNCDANGGVIRCLQQSFFRISVNDGDGDVAQA